MPRGLLILKSANMAVSRTRLQDGWEYYEGLSNQHIALSGYRTSTAPLSEAFSRVTEFSEALELENATIAGHTTTRAGVRGARSACMENLHTARDVRDFGEIIRDQNMSRDAVTLFLGRHEIISGVSMEATGEENRTSAAPTGTVQGHCTGRP